MAALLHELLEAQAERHPSRTALRTRAGAPSYAELRAAANGVARRLSKIGVGRGDRVGLHLEKCPEAIAAIYGILGIGAAYVPLDTASPPQRVAAMIEDCGLATLLSERRRFARFARARCTPKCLRTVLLRDGETRERSGDGGPDVEPWPPAGDPGAQLPGAAGAREADTAYVLYTSGSTGRPKGVALSHRAALAFVDWAAEYAELGPDDRLASHAGLHFDLSVFDLFAAARAGASVTLLSEAQTLLPAESVNVLREEALTVWYSVPSALVQMLLRGGLLRHRYPRLRLVAFAGEPFPPKHLRALAGHLGGVRLCNWYGPTETNVCTFYPVRELGPDDDPIPIGRPCANDEVFLVDDRGRPAGDGEVGELCVRGPTLMDGYLGQEERSREVLVPDPRPGAPPGLVYRTGDLARLDRHGDYRLLGRRDDQIKTRGHRVDPGEVENAFLSHPEVVEAAVVPLVAPDGEARLAAFVVAATPSLEEAPLRRWVLDRVPRYMMPDRVLLPRVLPRTSTGKVDRAALREILAGASSGGGPS